MATSRKANIALIGGRASGKSTLAQALGHALGREVIVLDLLIAAKAGMSIAAIVERHGWQHFRSLELAVLEDVATTSNTIWDCGGGIVCEQDAAGTQSFSQRKADLLKRSSTVIFLDVPAETLKARLLADSAARPSLTSSSTIEELDEVMTLRRPWYLQVADVVIDTEGRAPEAIVEEISQIVSEAQL